jgi:hypothetical protein
MNNLKITLSSLGALMALAGCGGDLLDGSPPATLSGVAATGAAMSGATVGANCGAGGATATGTTAADGSFSLTLGRFQKPPCLVQVKGGGLTLHGFAGSGGRVNVTPITNLIIANALGSDPALAFSNFDAAKSAKLLAGLAAANTYVNAQVLPLTAVVQSGDPIAGEFKVGDSNDKLLDSLGAALKAAGKKIDDLIPAASSGASLAAALGPEETRAQDSRIFTPADPTATTFAAMTAQSGDTVEMSTTSRWAGVMANSAAYRVEVPANWNGKLVMYAHGYAGTGDKLAVQNPGIRRFLIQNGYAWAASSYSKNYYDVRAGVEDTNALALAFNKIAAANSRPLAAPSKIYITGVSMGGHITAAAIEEEASLTANNKVKYNGAVPMCGVLGDTELFNGFLGMQVAAQTLTGFANTPVAQWSSVSGQITPALFSTYPSPRITTTVLGAQYASVVANLTGGARPLFAEGLAFGGAFPSAYGNFGSDGTVNGILSKNVTDTTGLTYVIDGDAAASASLNASAQKLSAAADANRLRRDGLRWIPKVNGKFDVPVVSIHTLGDLYVPFSMEQVYRKRAVANGSGDRLVQRAIRGASHCDFTVAEMADAFDAMVKWERDGIKPAGDDVLTPATVASPTYACTHTKNTLGPDDSGTTRALRPAILAVASCPAS